MRRIALINQKGGVGKTTTAVNLGAALAELGRRVVLCDLDPQANLTLHLGLELAPEEPSSYGLLVGRNGLAEALRDTSTPGLRAVGTTIDLSGAELELAPRLGRETILRDAVVAWQHSAREAEGAEPADYLIFDCPPSLGLLAINALTAADEVFLAVQTEFFALQGMSKLVELVSLVQRRLHPGLAITGIVPCLYDNRLRLAREVLADLRAYFPGQVFAQAIGQNVKLAEAPSFGQTILQYAPESAGSRDYRQLARQVVAQEESPAKAEPAPEPEARTEPAPTVPEPTVVLRPQASAAPMPPVHLAGASSPPPAAPPAAPALPPSGGEQR